MTTLTATPALIRLILCRDRIRIPLWILGTVFTVVGTAAALPGSYPTAEGRQARAQLVDSPALRMMLGPGYGIYNYTFGAMLQNEMFGLMSIVLALMGILTVVRHTRTEEESGRLELLRSGPVGRQASLTAALLVVTGMNLVIALLLAVLLPITLDALSRGGSLLFALALAATGVFFAAVAAVMAQVNEFGRGAIGASAAVLGIAYAVRGFGDVNPSMLSWLSPIGWGQQAAPYVLDRWWPLLLTIIATILLIVLAYALSSRRDLGSGMLPSRPGKPYASAVLTAPLGLPLRLQRVSIAGWTIGIVLLAIAVGSMAPNLSTLVEENPAIHDLIDKMGASGPDLIDTVLSLYLTFIALLVSVFSVGAVTRLRGEEESGRAENILTTPVSKVRWATEYLVVSLVISTVILMLAGFGMGAMYASSSGNTDQMWRVTEAAAVYAPALWLCAGVALAVFGLLPRAMVLAWLVPVYALVSMMLLPLLGAPQVLTSISPFAYIPETLTSGFELLPLLVLTLIAGIAIGLGLVGLRRRDICA